MGGTRTAGGHSAIEWLLDPAPTVGDAAAPDTATGERLDHGPTSAKARRPWQHLPPAPERSPWLAHWRRGWHRAGRRTQVVIVVVGLVAGTIAIWYADRTPALHPTLAGVRVEAPASVLATADRQLRGYVLGRSGSLSPQSRCYFDRTGAPARSDVANTLYCGPALFYDGSASAAYLQFPLAAASHGDRVTLTPAPTPVDPVPAALPAEAVLERTDHAQPPSGADGLTPPVPPPAARDLFVAVDGSDVPGVQIASPRAIMGGLGLTLTLEAVGPIDHFGHNSTERSAPAGQRLIAFEIVMSDGEQASRGDAPDIAVGVRIDGAAVRALPHAVLPFAPYGQWFIVAVPAVTRGVNLVFGDEGITQSVSLLTGEPSPGNIEVLQRTDRVDSIINAFDSSAVIDDHGQRRRVAVTIEKDPAYLQYFGPQGQHPPPDHAYVQVALCYRIAGAAECPPLSTSDMLLTPTGGRPIRGRNVGTGSLPYDVFEVPASYSTGDLTLASTVTIAPGVSMSGLSSVSVPILFEPQ